MVGTWKICSLCWLLLTENRCLLEEMWIMKHNSHSCGERNPNQTGSENLWCCYKCRDKPLRIRGQREASKKKNEEKKSDSFLLLLSYKAKAQHIANIGTKRHHPTRCRHRITGARILTEIILTLTKGF